jgi:hypothetical protein
MLPSAGLIKWLGMAIVQAGSEYLPGASASMPEPILVHPGDGEHPPNLLFSEAFLSKYHDGAVAIC